MKARFALLFVLIFALGVLAGRGTVDQAAAPAGSPASADARPSAADHGATPAMNVLPAAAPTYAPTSEDLTSDETRTIEVFRNAAASVVNVTSLAYRRDLFSMNVLRVPRGSGSGFVWDDKGHVVTNFHVIQGASGFVVTLADKTEWEADVVGHARDKDLAVLRINAPAGKLVPLPLGRSRTLVVGQRVLAIGNPFGLDHSLTVGVVSALGRELESPGQRIIRDVIQTDAAINPGNSGGPLLDSSGRLIGVNTAIYSPSGGSAGIGFAVPVDIVRRLVPQLIEHGKPIQPGIGIRPLPDYIAADNRIRGVVVGTVSEGGPAARAGLEGIRRGRRGLVLGDVIVGVNDQPIEGIDDLLDAFERLGVGSEAALTVERDGKRRQVRLELVPVG